MTWNAHPTISTGSTFTAANWNTYVKGNLDTLFPYTAGQQVSYSTSTDSLNKATSVGLMSVLLANSGNTAIEFGSIVYARQVKTSTGTVNTTGSNTVMQHGYYDFGSTDSSSTITFPTPFTSVPTLLVFVGQNNGASYAVLTVSNFILFGFFNARVFWIAIGEI